MPFEQYKYENTRTNDLQDKVDAYFKKRDTDATEQTKFEHEKALKVIPQATEGADLAQKKYKDEQGLNDRLMKLTFGATGAEIDHSIATSTGTAFDEARDRYKPFARRLLEKQVDPKFKPEEAHADEKFHLQQQEAQRKAIHDSLKQITNQIQYEQTRTDIDKNQVMKNVENLYGTLAKESQKLRGIIPQQEGMEPPPQSHVPKNAPQEPQQHGGNPAPRNYRSEAIDVLMQNKKAVTEQTIQAVMSRLQSK